jgi:L-ascorbate metabolism protein UlaG (beta-lactamase superfamily)
MLSGDTLTGAHLDTIHQRHPDIDVAVVHLGGARVLWHTVTMDAAQGLDYLRRIKPQRAVPVHYDDYGVMRSPLSEFLAAVTGAGLTGVVQPVRRGDRISL